MYRKKEHKNYYSKTKLNNLSVNSANIDKKLNINCYINKPNSLISGGKYNHLNHFFNAEFLAYYSINNKPDNSSEYQADEFSIKETIRNVANQNKSI